MAISTEGHIVRRFDGDMNNLHLLVLEMAGLVKTQAQMAIESLFNKDLNKAHAVIKRDMEVNQLEKKIDEQVVAVLARRCPVAQDLRVVIAISKVVTDLERIGDEASRIAEISLSIYESEGSDPSSQMFHDANRMGSLVNGMLTETMAALDCLDEKMAQAVLNGHGESEFSAEFRSGFRRLATFIMEDHRNVGHAINIVLVCKALERIGEHSRNIAEFLIYMVKGVDIRHGSRETGVTAKA